MDKIDKAAWQKTIAHYRAWNEAEFRERIKHAGKKSPEQKWREFLAIMEFGLMIKPQPGEHEHRQKIEMLNRYYERIQVLRIGDPSLEIPSKQALNKVASFLMARKYSMLLSKG